MSLGRETYSHNAMCKKGSKSTYKVSPTKKVDYPTFTKELFCSVFPPPIPDVSHVVKGEVDPDEFFSTPLLLGSGRMGQAYLARRREFTRYPCSIVPRQNDDTLVVWVRMDARAVDYVDAIRAMEPFAIDTISPSLFLCKLILSFQSRFPDQNLQYHLILKYEKRQTSFCKHLQQVGKLSEAGVTFYAMELACALFHIHSFNIIFRRLCTCCLIVKENGHLLLTPYSMCQQTIDCNQPCNMLSSNCGDQFYAAPEVVFGIDVQNTADWWSYGVIVYQMLTSKHPFTGTTLGDLGKAITEFPPVIPSHVSPEGSALIKQLLHKDPRRRLGFGKAGPQCIEKHPFFFGMDWSDMGSLRSEANPPFI